VIEKGDGVADGVILLFAEVVPEHIPWLRSALHVHGHGRHTRIAAKSCHCLLVNSAANTFGSVFSTNPSAPLHFEPASSIDLTIRSS